MKLQILHLKPHDDHISAREKLAWVKADRVLMVWPRHGLLLQRRLDLVLLRRKAAQQGLQLGLVTHDPQVQDHAARWEIPIFDSLDSLPEERWRRAEQHQPAQPRQNRSDPKLPPQPPDTPRRRYAPLRRRAIRLPLFALGLAAFLSLIAALGPSARLITTPETRNRRAQGEVRLDPGLQSPEPQQAAIPAQLVRTEVTGSMRARTSGQRTQPSSPAEGTIIFRNLSDEEQRVPTGTSVRTASEPSQRFLTTEAVTVPAGQGQTASTTVRAAEAGRAGNVAAGAVQAIDGPLGLALAVENPEPLRGGAEAPQPAVTEQDHERLFADLSENLLSQAGAELRAELESGYSLAASSLQVDRALRQRYDRQPGEVGASVGLELELRVSGLAYRTADLRGLVEARVTSAEPQGWAPVPGGLAVQVNRTDGSQARGVVVHYDVTWTRYRIVDAVAVRWRARGADPAAAERTLAQEFDLQDLSVRLRPQWLPRLPYVPARIKILYPWQAGP